MTLTEVADIMQTDYTEKKLEDNPNFRWCVNLPRVEIVQDKSRKVYVDACGFGETKTEARRNLAERIAGQTLVKNAAGSTRFEVTFPKTISGRL